MNPASKSLSLIESKSDIAPILKFVSTTRARAMERKAMVAVAVVLAVLGVLAVAPQEATC
jgi:hypothetical protein